ncbi:MAG: TspO/MBR family protein [Rothia sp. (in: high G+C Gram-positive bacteria)]|nr:TspO/MBR family protein [Rothia sp. (in: high G+C Gram-positive bacteria)]
MKTPKTFPSFLLTTGTTLACAAVGTWASDPHTAWYRSLNKPSWNPPNIAFPIAWTSLYADIAITTGIAHSTLRKRRHAQEARRYLGALGVNLVLNASWSYVFFQMKNTELAVVNAALLAASSIDLARRTGRISKSAGVALAPYAAWTSFATALSTSIWQRNK